MVLERYASIKKKKARRTQGAAVRWCTRPRWNAQPVSITELEREIFGIIWNIFGASRCSQYGIKVSVSILTAVPVHVHQYSTESLDHRGPTTHGRPYFKATLAGRARRLTRSGHKQSDERSGASEKEHQVHQPVTTYDCVSSLPASSFISSELSDARADNSFFSVYYSGI
jgi:hypothetical protein